MIIRGENLFTCKIVLLISFNKRIELQHIITLGIFVTIWLNTNLLFAHNKTFICFTVYTSDEDKLETLMEKVKRGFSYAKKCVKLNSGKQYYQVSSGYMDFTNFQNHFILQPKK